MEKTFAFNFLVPFDFLYAKIKKKYQHCRMIEKFHEYVNMLLSLEWNLSLYFNDALILEISRVLSRMSIIHTK